MIAVLALALLTQDAGHVGARPGRGTLDREAMDRAWSDFSTPSAVRITK